MSHPEDRWLDSHPHATPYHTRAWRRATEHVFGCRVEVLRNDAALLPLTRIRGTWISMPWRDRGGLLFTDEAAARALARETSALGRVELRQWQPAPFLTEMGFRAVPHWIHRELRLGDPDALWEGFRKHVRRDVRRAERLGVRVEWARGRAAADRFWPLFSARRRALGVPTYPRAWFRALAESFDVDFGLSAGGAVCLLRHAGRTIYGYAATTDEGRRRGAADLLLWESIRLAAGRGDAVFDFGADSPHNQSLITYKEKWGGLQRTLVSYVLGDGSPLDSDSAAWEAVRRVWSRLPRAAVDPLGGWLVRYLG